MRTVFACLVLILAMVTPAAAFEVRAGISNVQVRDRSFDNLADGFDDLFDIGPWYFFNALHLQGSVELWEKTDVVGALRYGTESGALRGIDTRLMLIEPAAGLRRRFPLHKAFVAHGQALLAIPYMESTFYAPGKDSSHRAALVTLTPSVGATFFPLFEKKRNWGISGEIGYSTPASMSFSEHNGVSPGSLNYGGVTYGIFVVFRNEPKPPISQPIDAQPEEVMVE